MRIEDAYKWLFQATLGGEHAVHDLKMVRDWLESEWKTLGKPAPSEPLLVPLDPVHKLVRLNLRPFKAQGGTKAQVLALFVSSAKTFHGDRKAFVREWDTLRDRLQGSPIGRIDLAAWTRLDGETSKQGYPAIDHSAEYERAAKPAYRVVLSSLVRPVRK